MSIFLISVSSQSVEEPDWSIDSALRQLVDAGVDVVRVWTTPEPYADFLIARASEVGSAELAVNNVRCTPGGGRRGDARRRNAAT